MGKRIVPLLLVSHIDKLEGEASKRFATVRAEHQGINLLACFNETGIFDLNRDTTIGTRLKTELHASGASADAASTPRLSQLIARFGPFRFPVSCPSAMMT